MTLVYTMWFTHLRPQALREDFYIQFFNETSVLLCCYHMMVLTDFVQDEETIFIVGYSFVVTTGLMIFVNLGRLIINIVSQCK